MLDQNRNMFEYLNIPAWHDAGYTGSRGLSATQEAWDINKYNLRENVTVGDPSLLSESAHPINTTKCFFEIAPDRKLIQLPYATGTMSNGSITSTFFTTVFSALRSLNVDVMWGSMISPFDGIFLDQYLQQLSSGLTYVMNSSSDCGSGKNKMLGSKYIYGSGAFKINNPDRVPEIITGKDVRYDTLTCVPTDIYIPYTNEEYVSTTNCRKFSGASCSAAILGGLMSLINDFFIDKSGKPLSSTSMRRFVKQYSTPIGHGFVSLQLPNIKDIKISDFSTESRLSVFDITDGDKIDPKAVDAVLKAISSNIMSLDETDSFYPDKMVTRQDLAAVIAKLMK